MSSSPRAAGGAPTDLSREVEGLIARWAGVIVRAARQYGLDASEQDEVTQDLRLRFWGLLERAEAGAPAINATYAMRAASSAAVDLVRRNRMRRDAAHEEVSPETAGAVTVEDDLAARLNEAIDTLIPSRRLAVRLHLDGRSLPEIARILKWTEAQARNQVYRGLADLKAHLREE
ncbi:MAG: sigma-70 family RNA polymerase sigma factor [Gemmatimonadetes bacterium]|nr:sigma-70 family RNA polymerase sigma factor [Gemmatimonadota bacterium]